MQNGTGRGAFLAGPNQFNFPIMAFCEKSTLENAISWYNTTIKKERNSDYVVTCQTATVVQLPEYSSLRRTFDVMRC